MIRGWESGHTHHRNLKPGMVEMHVVDGLVTSELLCFIVVSGLNPQIKIPQWCRRLRRPHRFLRLSKLQPWCNMGFLISLLLTLYRDVILRRGVNCEYWESGTQRPSA